MPISKVLSRPPFVRVLWTVAFGASCSSLGCSGDDGGAQSIDGGQEIDGSTDEFGTCRTADRPAQITCDGIPGNVVLSDETVDVSKAFFENGWIHLSTSGLSVCGAYDFTARNLELNRVSGDIDDVGCYDEDETTYAGGGGINWIRSQGPVSVWVDVVDGLRRRKLRDHLCRRRKGDRCLSGRDLPLGRAAREL